MNIFVGNLSFSCVEADLEKLFEAFGSVTSVAIVMRKEKKVPKSRGFGFVEMPDEQQALAAIAGLNGKEFMGRILDVNPARPKKEVQAQVRPSQVRDTQAAGEESRGSERTREDNEPRARTEYGQYPGKEREEKPLWGDQPLRRPGKYKGGRRTISYMKRRRAAGLPEESGPRRRPQDNPMRWRKREPWQKSPGEHKPWKRVEEGGGFRNKTEGEPRPWKSPGQESRPLKRPEGQTKPWRKSESGFKSWKKASGEASPWKKAEGGSRHWKKPGQETRPWKRTEGGAKPWEKTAAETRAWSKPGEKPKPWKKPSGEAKPWRKSGERPQRSRSGSRRKPGGYKK